MEPDFKSSKTYVSSMNIIKQVIIDYTIASLKTNS